MAYAPPTSPPPRRPTNPPPPNLTNGPVNAQAQPPTNSPQTKFSDEIETIPPPPKDCFPCGCAYPGGHKSDCMWSLWEQMKDNYLQTKKLMGQFMSQVEGIQSVGKDKPECKCPPGCHGQDLGEALGMKQLQGVTIPWQQTLPGLTPNLRGNTSTPAAQSTGYPAESEARRLMEEQHRIKNTWVQFLNIFDMSLDLANEVSKDRWEANKRRKERERLERVQRLEELRRERAERGSGASEKLQPEEKPHKSDAKKEENKEEMKKQSTKSAAKESPKSTPKSSKTSENQEELKNEEEEIKEADTEPDTGSPETEEPADEEKLEDAE